MGKYTHPRQKAIGAIGPGKLADWEAAGLAVVYQADWLAVNKALSEQIELVKELERRNKLLRDVTIAGGDDIAAKVLREAMQP